MKDEELDKLFRDAAERFAPPPVSDEAWDKFYKTKLLLADDNIKEKETPHFNQKRFSWVSTFQRKWQLAAACLIFMIIGFLWLNQQNKNHKITESLTYKKDIKPENPLQKNNNENIIDSNILNPPIQYKELAHANKKSFTVPFPENENEYLVDEKIKLDSFYISEKRVETAPDNNINADNNKKTVFSFREKANQPIQDKSNFSNGKNASSTTTVWKNKNDYGTWQLGIVAGSNLGMIKGDVGNKPGVNAGLLVQKKLGQSRFSIESGVVYESMNYGVKNEDFNPDGQPVSSKVSNIEGSCSMIDVPINVRYDVVSAKKKRAFVSTGVSPTVIVKQNYTYNYESENTPEPISKDVSGKGKNVYAVANLSVGFEQKWDNISVQVAPYIKIPMGEIGYGNLNLGGLGTQISIKRAL